MFAQIHAAIRANPRVCADETALRQAGAYSYLWSFSTERARLFVHGRRAQAVADAVLCPDFTGC